MKRMPSARRNTSLLRFTLVLLAIGACVFAAYRLAAPEAGVKAGDCVAMTFTGCGTGQATMATCDNEKSMFRVGKVLTRRGENCPDGHDEYTVLVDPKAGTLCLLPHLVKGSCYRPGVPEHSWYRAQCTGEGGIKVTEVLAGTTDHSRCPARTEAMSYDEPRITYCYTNADF